MFYLKSASLHLLTSKTSSRKVAKEIAKFRAENRILKLGTKNALFGCLGQQL